MPACRVIACLSTLGLGLLAAIACVAAEEPAPKVLHAPGLQIMSAAYGSERLRTTCSALLAVKQRCEGQIRCNVTVSAALCPIGDRLPELLFPQLAVGYRCSEQGAAQLKHAERPFALRLSCAGLLQ